MGNGVGVVVGEMGMGMGMQCNVYIMQVFRDVRSRSNFAKRRGEGKWYEIDNRTQGMGKGGHCRTNSKSLPSKCI